MKLSQKSIKVLKKFGIDAAKIALTAAIILNIIAGNEINLTSKEINIASDNFNVEKNGKVKIISEKDDTTGESSNLTVISKDGKYITEIYPSLFKTTNLDNDDGVYISSFPYIVTINGELRTQTGMLGYVVENIYSGDKSILSEIGLEIQTDGETNTTVLATGITTPVVTQTSLEESKKNFEKLKSGLDILKNIDIYKYNLKNEEDTTKKHIGFVIGDNYNYSEEITSNNNDGVDIYSFVAVCCKAIQEQQEQIEQLQEENKQKDELLQDLIKRIEKLEGGSNE